MLSCTAQPGSRGTRKERQIPVHCPPPTGCGEARSSARSAHRNGHFPSPWKMSETPRAVRRDRAQYVGTRHERSERSGAREGISVWRGGGALLSAAARCDPDTLSWRPKCSSQAHYAAAAPRPAQPAGKGGPGKTGGPRPWRGCCPVPPGPAAGGRHPSFASERTFSVVVENVRDAACEGGRPPTDAKGASDTGTLSAAPSRAAACIF